MADLVAEAAEKRRPDGPEEEREREGGVRLHQSLGLAAASGVKNRAAMIVEK